MSVPKGMLLDTRCTQNRPRWKMAEKRFASICSVEKFVSSCFEFEFESLSDRLVSVSLWFSSSALLVCTWPFRLPPASADSSPVEFISVVCFIGPEMSQRGEVNRPFPSSPQPPFQSEAKCEVFVMKISFHSCWHWNQLPWPKFLTSTRFERETEGNSEMAY